MALPRWIQSWRKPVNAGVRTGAVTEAALDGAGLDVLLPLTARVLLEAAHADRAGIWLLAGDQSGQLQGIVLDAGQPPQVGAEWSWLDLSTTWFEQVLASREPVLTDLNEVPANSRAGPLARMHTALGIPLRVGRKPFGVVLVANALAGANPDASGLRALVDELALAVAFRRAQDQSLPPGSAALRPSGSGPAAGLRALNGQTEKLAALGQFVSGIAHELNNPLTSIMGYAQLLLARGSGQNRGLRGDLQRVYQEADRARRIVHNLLFFARQAKPERRPVDLNELVERTLALRSYELKVEDLSVELDLAPDLPPVRGDAHQLQQVVLNLLVNAEQAILQSRPAEAELPSPALSPGEGSGRIRVCTRALAEDRLVLEVTDSGPGITPAIAERIFDPFFTTKPLGQGTGLGLSIAYGIVQEHGGEIHVSSRPRDREASGGTERSPRGATFVVELPAGLGETEAAVPARPRPAARRIRRARVLVVEDEPTVAQLVADVLTEEGHQVESVLDSQEGLTRALREPYDLVICDLRMPRLDGRAFYEALVRAGAPARQRIAFITGDTLGPRTLEFLETNGLPYLGKPFLVEELKAMVSRILQTASVSPAESELVATPPSGPRREAVRKR